MKKVLDLPLQPRDMIELSFSLGWVWFLLCALAFLLRVRDVYMRSVTEREEEGMREKLQGWFFYELLRKLNTYILPLHQTSELCIVVV